MPAPLIIGHRGASAVTPENTLGAFRKAIEVGADGIEFDVRLTRDGIPVVIHDDNLRRTGGRPDLIRSVSLADLTQVDVGSWFTRAPDRMYAEERIPTLEQVFQLFETNNRLLYLEMKSDASQRSELARAVCESIRTSKLRDRVVVECFDHAAIEIVKRIDSEIKTAALFEPGLKNPPVVSSGHKLVDKARAVGADEIALHHRLASQRTIDTATKVGLKVVVWTVDNSDWIDRARNNGVKALITNDPEMMVRERDAATTD